MKNLIKISLLLFTLPLFSQVKLKYNGNDTTLNIVTAVCNELLQSGEFYLKIATCANFENTNLTPGYIANYIYGIDTTIIIKTYYKINLFRGPCEYMNAKSSNLIKINLSDVSKKLEREVNILMREIIKAIDMIDGKVDFSDINKNKYATAPYVIGDIAENMVRYGFGYD